MDIDATATEGRILVVDDEGANVLPLKRTLDITGVITLRHNSRLHHVGLGRRLTGTRVLVLVADLHVRV